MRAKALKKTMIEYFGRIKLNNITPALIQGFIDKLQDANMTFGDRIFENFVGRE